MQIPYHFFSSEIPMLDFLEGYLNGFMLLLFITPLQIEIVPFIIHASQKYPAPLF